MASSRVTANSRLQEASPLRAVSPLRAASRLQEASPLRPTRLPAACHGPSPSPSPALPPAAVDNSRAADVAVAVANKLGVDLDKLPVVASAPEAATEKALAIGTWAVAAGLPTHVGVIPPVLGGATVARVLTQEVKELVGGYFIVEPDPKSAADKLLSAIDERREGLGL